MPRSLVSYWKRVAISGPTADGREILPQELRDLAETYDIAKYTAVIWCEHERWYGSFGTVFSVRLVEDDASLAPGQVALEAQLKPNDRLLSLNDQGEKLFTSIEITPNFAQSGRAYLSGLAVTDSPASLGTQELYFSRKTGQPVHYAAAIPLGPLVDDDQKGEIGMLNGLLTRLFKRFGLEEKADDTPQTTTEKIPMDEATASAIQALIEQQTIVTAGLQALVDAVAVVTPAPDQTPIDDVQAAVDAIVTPVEEDKNLSSNKVVLAYLAKIDKKFNELANTPTGRQLPKTTGSTDTKKRVL